MATVAPPPAATPPPAAPVGELQIPRRLKRISPRVAIPVGLLLLTALSLFLRTRYISGQFWEDEGLSVGISSHSLAAIPGVLRHDGSPPLYYVLLHFWISAFGASESATHAFSLLCSMLAIPIGSWTAW